MRILFRAGRTNRRGAVLALALVCLLVVMTVGGLLLRAVLREQHQSLRREHLLQALWLAETAVGRARATLATAPDYAGESWRMSAEELGGSDAAVIEIRVEPVGEPPTARRIVIQATYPDDPQRQVVWHQTVEIQLPHSGEEP